MSIQQEIRQQVTALIRSGQRAEAKALLKTKFQVSEEQAEQLVLTIEKEKPVANVIVPQLGKRVSQGTGGCVPLILKGLMIFFFLITFIFAAFAIGIYFYENRFAGEGIAVEGIVISLTENDTGSLAPLIEYAWQDTLRQHQSNFYTSPPDYEVGQQVPLLLNPENPEEVIIDSFSDRYLISIVFGGIACFFLVFALTLGYVARKMKRSFEKSA
ncbi:MAG: DUF3592 domain-containing protein [Cyclobacteriaceae bacterium]|nr:DUF3592 domain-containing protein [Cyclobacteriaceae bacterium]